MNIEEKFVHPGYIREQMKLSEVYFYLDKYMDQEIFTMPDLKGNPSVKQDHIIWLFWLQGIENAPHLVHRCYESVCKNKPEDFELVLLSKENLDQYIQLPDYIWEKFRKGCISVTHLSDIIRLELLCTYGGCWIDATVFCSSTIPDYMLKGEMFLFKAPPLVDPVLKLSNWWLACNNHNRLMHATRKMLYHFWQQENDVRHYHIFHLIMSKLIDEDPACRSIFDNAPYFNNGNPHVLYKKFDQEFDEMEWEIIKDISVVHKLTYKIKYLQGDIYNFYMAFMEGKLV